MKDSAELKVANLLYSGYQGFFAYYHETWKSRDRKEFPLVLPRIEKILRITDAWIKGATEASALPATGKVPTDLVAVQSKRYLLMEYRRAVLQFSADAQRLFELPGQNLTREHLYEVAALHACRAYTRENFIKRLLDADYVLKRHDRIDAHTQDLTSARSDLAFHNQLFATISQLLGFQPRFIAFLKEQVAPLPKIFSSWAQDAEDLCAVIPKVNDLAAFGLEPAEALGWRSLDLSTEEVAAWILCGFSFGAVSTWRERGVNDPFLAGVVEAAIPEGDGQKLAVAI